MNFKYREKLIKEIATKEDVGTTLNWLISIYNERFNDLKATVDDFGIRLAKTPEEACYISTIITCSKFETTMDEVNVKEKAKYYDFLLKEGFNKNLKELKPKNLNVLSWNDLEKLTGICEYDTCKYNMDSKYLNNDEFCKKCYGKTQ